jgi:hypothetical protein
MRYIGSLATETVKIWDKPFSEMDACGLLEEDRAPVEMELKRGRLRIKKNDAIKLYVFILKTSISDAVLVVKGIEFLLRKARKE